METVSLFWMLNNKDFMQMEVSFAEKLLKITGNHDLFLGEDFHQAIKEILLFSIISNYVKH